MRSIVITLLLSLPLLVLPACGSDWTYDGSFEWGTGVGSTGGQVAAVGWAGADQDGLVTWDANTMGSANERGFNFPQGVCFDLSGNVYVADRDNHRVCRWSSDGVFQGWLGGGSDGWQYGVAPEWGSTFRDFDQPSDVAVDGAGNIYVADAGSHWVTKWTAGGTALGYIGNGLWGWSTVGTPSAWDDYDYFDGPRGIALDLGGNIYVADTNNNRICKWDASGNPQGWIGCGFQYWQSSQDSSGGTGAYFFSGPRGLAVNQAGDIFVADATNNRVCLWDGSGDFIGWLGGGGDGWNTGNFAPGLGSDIRSFYTPWDVFLTPNGIYVADMNNNRISQWDLNGYAQGWIGGGYTGWQQMSAPGYLAAYDYFDGPRSVAAAPDGRIVVADTNNHRVSVWLDPNGTYSLPPSGDTTPPDPVIDLYAEGGVSAGEVDLSWTATGDDGTVGQAHHYIVKVSISSIGDEADFDAATTYPQSWVPEVSGVSEYRTIMLAPATTFYIRIKVVDEVNNESTISNEVSLTTP